MAGRGGGTRATRRKSRFELENAARRTLAQALGGLLLVVGLAATWLQLDQSRQEQRDTAARVAAEQALTREEQALTRKRAATEQALTREGQITDRFTAAVGQLGSGQLRVRLGGIYALERDRRRLPGRRRGRPGDPDRLRAGAGAVAGAAGGGHADPRRAGAGAAGGRRADGPDGARAGALGRGGDSRRRAPPAGSGWSAST